MKSEVLEAIKASAAVPSMPQVVMRFLDVIQDPNFEYDQVVKVLSADPGTVSELLRLANSALFGLSRKVVSLRSALTLLGPRRTRALILGRYLIETLDQQKAPGLDIPYFWRRSLVRAVLAARLADAVAPRQREETFISGLLATIGIPILAQALTKAYGPLVARYTAGGAAFTAEDERLLVETTHGAVAAEVLGQWRLPEAICQTVGCYQLNVTGTDAVHIAGRLIRAADQVGKLLCDHGDPALAAPACMDAMRSVGADLPLLARILRGMEKDIEELGSVLHIDVIPSRAYTRIAKAIQDQIAAPAGA